MEQMLVIKPNIKPDTKQNAKPNKKYITPCFTYTELACKATGKVVLACGFAEKLTDLRVKFNSPMIISSACRSKEYNWKIGGAKKSLHVYDYPAYETGGCCAIDVIIRNSGRKGDLIALAWQLGWSVGVHKKFIHLDRRVDYTGLPQVLFVY